MKNLADGVIKFQFEDFDSHRDLFKTLSKQQQPHTLFIGCADSRVIPALITQTNPGELFTVRNIGNMVPPYAASEKYNSTTSAIEYAVVQLEVDTIVICGHSNCGGCAALYNSAEELEKLPHLRRWLQIAEDVPQMVEALLTEDALDEREWITEQVNVYVQLEHLLSYPYIRERVERGVLNIEGWHYIIESGEVFRFNQKSGFFELITENKC